MNLDFFNSFFTSGLKGIANVSGREFYTVIPHDFGFKKMRELPPPSQSHNALIWIDN